jgi:hypothetical protein
MGGGGALEDVAKNIKLIICDWQDHKIDFLYFF